MMEPDMRPTIIKMLLMIVLLCLASSGYTVPIGFKYTGSITETRYIDDDPFDGRISEGSSFKGLFFFDSDTPGSLNEFQKSYNNQPSLFLVNIEGITATSRITGAGGPSNVIRVNNDLDDIDAFDVNARDISLRGVFAESAVITLIDNDASVFNDASLPLSLDLEDFERREFSILARAAHIADWGGILGRIESITRIPEPPSILLFLAGIILIISIKKFTFIN